MSDEKDLAQENLKNLPVKVGQKYTHFKGGEYEIVAVGIKEYTLEPMVVYRSDLKGSTWIRTIENFTETVDRDGKTHKRFQLIIS